MELASPCALSQLVQMPIDETLLLRCHIEQSGVVPRLLSQRSCNLLRSAHANNCLPNLSPSDPFLNKHITHSLVYIFTIPHHLTICRLRPQEGAVIETVSLVQVTHFLHLLVSQREVKHLDVLDDTRGVHGLGNHNRSTLNGPAQHHLRGRLLVAVSDPQNDRVHQRRIVLANASVHETSQREVGFQIHAVPVAHLLQLPLLQIRMELHLVHRGLNRCTIAQHLKTHARVVGHSQRSHKSLCVNATL